MLGLTLAALAGCGDDDGDLGRTDMLVDGAVPDMPMVTIDLGPTLTECTADGMDSTLGQICLRDLDCSDACFCNGVELCMDGICTAGEAPCGRFDCSTGTCDESSRTCDETPDDSFCDDGVFCNGAETCDPENGCRPGVPPFCGDGDICTIDACDEGVAMCTHVVLDEDGDGEAARRCGGNDCDDTDSARSPSNAEICDNGIDDDCDNRVDGFDAECGRSNDRCTDTGDGRGPLDITPAGDGTTITEASTVGMAGDYDTACGETAEDAGPDAVFTFSLAEAKDVSVEVQGIDNNAILSLRDLASCATQTGSIRCSDTDTGVQPFVRVNSLPAGDYAIVVITEGETPFDLALTLAPATPIDQSSDSCDTTMLDISAGGSFAGNFDGDPRFDGDELSDQYTLSCRGATGYTDVTFRLTIPAGEARDVTLEGRSYSTSRSGRRPFMALVDDCDSPSDSLAACVESPANGEPASIMIRSLPGGEYFVILEEDFTSDGEWELDVTIGPPTLPNAGDSCVPTTPVDITSAEGTIDLATLEHQPDVGSFCRANGSGATDAFFEFTLAAESDVLVETSSSPIVRHIAALSTECGSIDTEFDCFSATTGAGSRLYQRLPAGTHYLNVTTIDSSGTVSAEVTVTPPTTAPPNNTCAGASPLTPNSAVTIDLPAYDDTANYCSVSGLLDAYYTFTLASPTEVALRARNAQRLTLLSGSCAGAQTCATGSPPRIEQLLPAGTYIVAVEADPFAAQPDTQLFFSTF